MRHDFLNTDCGSPRRRPQSCLPGDKHKSKPSPEGPEYAACHIFQESSCCTAEFTEQLSRATVTNIDGFHWNRCGDLSRSCEEFFVRIECFYRCSPNVAHWQSETFPSAFNCVPVCSEFCDNWFTACADDMSCVSNWITDWDTAENGSNFCPENSTCSTFSELYTDGRGLCETLWGNSFLYSNDSVSDPNRLCLVPSFPVGQTNPNDEVVMRLLGGGGGGSCQNVATISMVFTLVILILSLIM